MNTIPVFDGHNDLAWAIRSKFHNNVSAVDLHSHQPRLHTDIPRLRTGGVAAQFWSVFVPSDMAPAKAVTATLEQIDTVRRLADQHPDAFELVDSAAQARAAIDRGRIASLLGIEGGHCIDSSLGVLRSMRRLGVRYLTLTHNDDIPWASSATGAGPDAGLSEFGREVVREMNRIGMIVDLSHVSPQVMDDALAASARPVMFSHSSCRTVTDHPRNIPDAVLERLPANGGIAMVTFVPAFVSEACAEHKAHSAEARSRLGLPDDFHEGPAEEDPEALREFADWQAAHPAPTATLDDVIAHIEHAREVAGIEHIGLGGDFDGIEELPEDFDGVAAYPLVFRALADRGWSEADLRKLGAENALRVLADND
ncbi:dipeptidase [Brevibacterium daeguense]|uniref:dipeptidase n=1 Tax=Brevibacterium daeguense TaxID=909936 RepID=UPI001F3AA167